MEYHSRDTCVMYDKIERPHSVEGTNRDTHAWSMYSSSTCVGILSASTERERWKKSYVCTVFTWPRSSLRFMVRTLEGVSVGSWYISKSWSMNHDCCCRQRKHNGVHDGMDGWVGQEMGLRKSCDAISVMTHRVYMPVSSTCRYDQI